MSFVQSYNKKITLLLNEKKYKGINEKKSRLRLISDELNLLKLNPSRSFLSLHVYLLDLHVGGVVGEYNVPLRWHSYPFVTNMRAVRRRQLGSPVFRGVSGVFA